jgi:tetraacyldisaccharide 4'-kinase
MKQIITFLPSLLFGLITYVRNKLFDWGILPSTLFDKPRVIVVGNLSVGGTGKSPLVTYLVQNWRGNDRLGILSRGYGRKTKGYVEVNVESTADEVGDEPLAYKTVFPELPVAVCEKRTEGVQQMPEVDVLLLDDAFQHRSVRAGFYILLTTFDALYVDDYLLPTGNLRESKSAAHRADLIVVTKCLPTISASEMKVVKDKLNIDKPLFFSTISYDDSVYSLESSLKVHELQSNPKLLVAGIANPKAFFDYLQNEGDEIMSFPDHHHFSASDLERIKKSAGNSRIITTEKDFVRLKEHFSSSQLFYLPIRTTFIDNGALFDQKITQYMSTVSRIIPDYSEKS